MTFKFSLSTIDMWVLLYLTYAAVQAYLVVLYIVKPVDYDSKLFGTLVAASIAPAVTLFVVGVIVARFLRGSTKETRK